MTLLLNPGSARGCRRPLRQTEDRSATTSSGYAYDGLQRLQGRVDYFVGTGNDVYRSCSYNPAGQLSSQYRDIIGSRTDPFAWTNHYAVNRAYTANGLNQYSASGSITPTYDARGNVESAGSSTYYIYNSENMLTSSWGQATLSYDPLLRLFQVSGASTTRMLYDGESLIAEYDSGNSLLRRYVHGPGVDEPLVWYEGTGTSDRRFYHADERGSVVATSNSSGAMLSVNAYDEYGIPGASNSGRFQYTGQQWLPELGVYHYRARIYSPTLGRFLQTDPIGYAGGMNIYAYVGNDPVNLVDPSGLLPPPPGGDECSNPDNCGTVTGPRRVCNGGTERTSNGGCTQNNLDLIPSATQVVLLALNVTTRPPRPRPPRPPRPTQPPPPPLPPPDNCHGYVQMGEALILAAAANEAGALLSGEVSPFAAIFHGIAVGEGLVGAGLIVYGDTFCH